MSGSGIGSSGSRELSQVAKRQCLYADRRGLRTLGCDVLAWVYLDLVPLTIPLCQPPMTFYLARPKVGL